MIGLYVKIGPEIIGKSRGIVPGIVELLNMVVVVYADYCRPYLSLFLFVKYGYALRLTCQILIV